MKIEIEAELVQTRQLISLAEASLNWLTSPDYNPDQNPDHECREQDIEFLEYELAQLNRDLNKLLKKSQIAGGE